MPLMPLVVFLVLLALTAPATAEAAEPAFAFATRSGVIVQLSSQGHRWPKANPAVAHQFVLGRMPPIAIDWYRDALVKELPSAMRNNSAYWQVFDGGRIVCSGRLVGGRIGSLRRPADWGGFDNVYQRDPERGPPEFDTSDGKGAGGTRGDPEVAVFARVKGCRPKQVRGWLWARPSQPGRPIAHRTRAATSAATTRVANSSEWLEAVKHVTKLRDGRQPKIYQTVFATPGKKLRWLSVHLQLGESEVGLYREAQRWEFFEERNGRAMRLAFSNETGVKRIEPMIVGDLNGDGRLDMIALVDWWGSAQLSWYTYSKGKLHQRRSLFVNAYVNC